MDKFYDELAIVLLVIKLVYIKQDVFGVVEYFGGIENTHSGIMNSEIINHSSVKIGFVPSHIGLAKSHLPDENGRLSRNVDGDLDLLAGIAETVALSQVKIDTVQVMTFTGVVTEDFDELLEGICGLGVEPQIILMIGGVDPMDPVDEDACVIHLLEGVGLAKRHKLRHIASTSAEGWMSSPAPKDNAEYLARVDQVIQVHSRVYKEAELENSSIESWSLEFLRPGEMNTFTSIPKIQPVVSGLNEIVGGSFFKILIDAAHCGDGELSIGANELLIAESASRGEFNVFHASVPTTRGCHASDRGWVAPLLKVAVDAGRLEYVFIEVFQHSDPILEALREYDPRHGVDTSEGRGYIDVVCDNLGYLANQLNSLQCQSSVERS